MNNKENCYQVICPVCKHRWILIANRPIYVIEYNVWLLGVKYQHSKLGEK